MKSNILGVLFYLCPLGSFIFSLSKIDHWDVNSRLETPISYYGIRSSWFVFVYCDIVFVRSFFENTRVKGKIRNMDKIIALRYRSNNNNSWCL